MKKNTIKFSFYLLFFSFLAKMLSFLSRVIMARQMDSLAMSYYTILSPTIVILISIVQMGIPSVLSKLVADKHYQFKILSTSIYFTIFTTSITTLVYLLCIPFLSHLLFKENVLSIFYSVLPFLPLVALSGLLKGYLMGKQHFVSSSFTQIIEEIARIVFLVIAFLYLGVDNSIDMAKYAILSISVGEAFSCLFMFLCIFLEKKTIFKKMEYSKESLKSILAIALPMSGSRFIGSFCYFLEPILMGMSLSFLESKSMMLSYGVLNGYVLPLLTMPSFVTITLSNYLLPSFTYHYSRNNKQKANRLFYQISWFCLAVGIAYSALLFFYSDEICMLFYKSTTGSDFLKYCSIPFIFYSLQPIFGIMLHALDKSKESTIDTFVGCIIRLAIVTFLSHSLQENALLLALNIGMLVTTFMHYYHLRKTKKKSLV